MLHEFDRLSFSSLYWWWRHLPLSIIMMSLDISISYFPSVIVFLVFRIIWTLTLPKDSGIIQNCLISKSTQLSFKRNYRMCIQVGLISSVPIEFWSFRLFDSRLWPRNPTSRILTIFDKSDGRISLLGCYFIRIQDRFHYLNFFYWIKAVWFIKIESTYFP